MWLTNVAIRRPLFMLMDLRAARRRPGVVDEARCGSPASARLSNRGGEHVVSGREPRRGGHARHQTGRGCRREHQRHRLHPVELGRGRLDGDHLLHRQSPERQLDRRRAAGQRHSRRPADGCQRPDDRQVRSERAADLAAQHQRQPRSWATAAPGRGQDPEAPASHRWRGAGVDVRRAAARDPGSGRPAEAAGTRPEHPAGQPGARGRQPERPRGQSHAARQRLDGAARQPGPDARRAELDPGRQHA